MGSKKLVGECDYIHITNLKTPISISLALLARQLLPFDRLIVVSCILWPPKLIASHIDIG